MPPKFSFDKKLVDFIKKIDTLFTETKEDYAHQLFPVKRNQQLIKKYSIFFICLVAALLVLHYYYTSVILTTCGGFCA